MRYTQKVKMRYTQKVKNEIYTKSQILSFLIKYKIEMAHKKLLKIYQFLSRQTILNKRKKILKLLKRNKIEAMIIEFQRMIVKFHESFLHDYFNEQKHKCEMMNDYMKVYKEKDK